MCKICKQYVKYVNGNNNIVSAKSLKTNTVDAKEMYKQSW